jgi:arylsulfatase A-like enzyme
MATTPARGSFPRTPHPTSAGRAPLAFAALVLAGCAAEPRPHVLLVSIDTLRADTVSAMPRLSALAASGASFPRVYASSNWTLPSHASLLLSQPYSEHRTPPLGARLPFSGFALPEGSTTLAEAFAGAGYRTIASNEGGFLSRAFGFARGFETYSQFAPLSHGGGDVRRHVDALEQHLGAIEGDPAFAFVHTYRTHDYFMNVPEFHSHLEPGDAAWSAEGSLLGKMRAETGEAPPAEFLRRLYRGAAADTDRFLAELIDAARAASPDRPWIVAVTSDHGESFGGDVWMRGHGTSLNESQLRIPWILWKSDGLEYRAAPPLASTLDIAPTLLHLAGVPAPSSFRGQILAGRAAARSAVVPREVAFYRQNPDIGLELHLGRVEVDATAVHVASNRRPSKTHCFRRSGDDEHRSIWAPEELAGCGELDDWLRDRVRGWIVADRERAMEGSRDDGHDALAEELRALGYL